TELYLRTVCARRDGGERTRPSGFARRPDPDRAIWPNGHVTAKGARAMTDEPLPDPMADQVLDGSAVAGNLQAAFGADMTAGPPARCCAVRCAAASCSGSSRPVTRRSSMRGEWPSFASSAANGVCLVVVPGEDETTEALGGVCRFAPDLPCRLRCCCQQHAGD